MAQCHFQFDHLCKDLNGFLNDSLNLRTLPMVVIADCSQLDHLPPCGSALKSMNLRDGCSLLLLQETAGWLTCDVESGQCCSWAVL